MRQRGPRRRPRTASAAPLRALIAASKIRGTCSAYAATEDALVLLAIADLERKPRRSCCNRRRRSWLVKPLAGPSASLSAAYRPRYARIERVISGAKYVHTNLIAREWRELARFYVDVFGCEPIPPQREQQGSWLDAATGLTGARLQGMHLRLPGAGPDGPTLEIYSYDDTGVRPPSMPNDTGYGHVAFSVTDVSNAVREIVDHGGTVLGQIASTTISGVGDLEVIYVRDPEGNIIELQTWRTSPG